MLTKLPRRCTAPHCSFGVYAFLLSVPPPPLFFFFPSQKVVNFKAVTKMLRIAFTTAVLAVTVALHRAEGATTTEPPLGGDLAGAGLLCDDSCAYANNG